MPQPKPQPRDRLTKAAPLDLSLLRWFLRRLVTPKEAPWKPGLFIRKLILMPVFGLFLILATIRYRLGRPIRRVVQLKDGSHIQCSPPDLVQMYIFIFGIWEPDLTHYINRRLEKGGTFIDIGANVGYFSLLASNIVGRDGRVVAVEASPRIFRMLNENIDRSHATNIRTVNVAASLEPGELKVYSGPDKNLGLTTTVKGRGFPAEVTVDALPLADILADEEISTASIVKIDVEGGEGDVLAGMVEFLQRCPEDVEILVELSPEWWDDPDPLPVDVLKPIVDLGFNVYETSNSYWPWRYLWPRHVMKPTRVRRGLNERVHRLDLVLSRRDLDIL